MVVGQMIESRDVVIIGGGPGGYEAALHVATLGRRAALIDINGEGGLGGTCLHHGCIPSKTLIESAHAAGGVFESYASSRQDVVESLRSGIESMVRARGVEVITGRARLLDGSRVVVEPADGPPSFYSYTDVIIATGSSPQEIPAVPFGGRVLDSAGILGLAELPKTVTVVGAGYIGVELGTALALLRSQVTMIDLAERILPSVDADLASLVHASLEALGVELLLGCESVSLADDGASLLLASGESTPAADAIVVAAGRTPNTGDLGLDQADLSVTGRGHIITDDLLRAAPHIYAIGDVVEGPALAHKASAEAKMVAEVIAGISGHRDVGHIPAVVYSDPELASVGVTKAEAAEADGAFVVGEYRLAHSGRARTMGRTQGLARIVADADTGTIVGAQLACPAASEMISIATMAVELGATLEDVDGMIFPHPTLSELFQGAALAAHDSLRRKRDRA